jgi:hypothetical protein
MTEAQSVYQTAQYMRELARNSDLPGYIEMLLRAADDLEKRAAELECQTPLAA